MRWKNSRCPKRPNFYIRIERCQVCYFVYFWSELLCLFWKLESFPVNSKICRVKLIFVFHWTMIFPSPSQTTPSPLFLQVSFSTSLDKQQGGGGTVRVEKKWGIQERKGKGSGSPLLLSIFFSTHPKKTKINTK